MGCLPLEHRSKRFLVSIFDSCWGLRMRISLMIRCLGVVCACAVVQRIACEIKKIKMAEILLGDRKLTDLKVTALKAELDKRGLPKKGVKSVLVERLKKAILQEELSNVSEFFAPTPKMLGSIIVRVA